MISEEKKRKFGIVVAAQDAQPNEEPSPNCLTKARGRSILTNVAVFHRAEPHGSLGALLSKPLTKGLAFITLAAARLIGGAAARVVGLTEVGV